MKGELSLTGSWKYATAQPCTVELPQDSIYYLGKSEFPGSGFYKFEFKKIELIGGFPYDTVTFKYGKDFDDPLFEFRVQSPGITSVPVVTEKDFDLTLYTPLKSHKNSLPWVEYMLPRLFKGGEKNE